MKLVLDTNIYISTIIFNKSLEETYLEIISDKNTDCYFSKETWLELENKINSPKIAKLLDLSKRGINEKHITKYLSYIKANSIFLSDISTKINIYTPTFLEKLLGRWYVIVYNIKLQKHLHLFTQLSLFLSL
jgi:putative PIN family toxin of toxin-antitoxin system